MPELNIVSQNVYLDYTRTKKRLILPQDARIGSIAATFERFSETIDVAGVQEAHLSKRQHNGMMLANRIGYGDGYWFEHNNKMNPDSRTGRPNEYIGLFGAKVGHAEPIDIGDNRLAVMTVIDGIAFVNQHLRAGRKARHARHDQAGRILDAIDGYDDAVVFGDLNEPPVRYVAKARDEYQRAGFVSVFDLTMQPHPITFPVPGYGATHSRHPVTERRTHVRPMSLDDMLVRGPRIKVLGAGVLERVIEPPDTDEHAFDGVVPYEGSDHEGIWARLDIQPLQA
jgi:endonuclease/exonuclease/phosphatase family metal-dependent hydrolase